MANVILTLTNLLVLFTILLTIGKANGEAYGIMIAQTSRDKEQFCILYYPEFSHLASSKAEGAFVQLVDPPILPSFCNPQEAPLAEPEDRYILIDPDNCTINEKAETAFLHGWKGIIVVTNRDNAGSIQFNASDVNKENNITVALITESSVERLSEMGSDVKVLLYSPHGNSFDFSFLMIFTIAVTTVAIGAYWSGLVRHALHNLEVNKLSENNGGSSQLGNEQKSDSQGVVEESTLNISPLYIAVIVMCMISMLLLLYFFFSYLVYVIIGLFVLASIIAVANCLEVLFFCFECNFESFRSWQTNSRFFSAVWWRHLRYFIIISIAITLAVIWVVYRNESFSWILQDILGVAFIMNMLKSVRLPSFKICTVLLVLLFFYDIFFVFVTPYLTKKGDSVMVEVATGGNSKEQTGKITLFENADASSNEQLPMVLRIPHLRLDPWTTCYLEYTLLGFGDILVPGLLVSYCHGIDMYLKNRKVYYITTLISYAVGLVVTFGGLYLMNMPQPALLYLVPATLLPPIILAKIRNELTLLWNGVKLVKPELEQGLNVEVVRELEGGLYVEEPVLPNAINVEAEPKATQREGSLASDGNGEKKLLLHNEGVK